MAGERGDDDEDFLALLDDYVDEPHDPNPRMANVEVVWIEGDPRVGALHIAAHGVTKDEVEQVLFEIPPVVEPSGHVTIQTGRSSGAQLVTIAGSSSCARTGPKARCVT